MKQVVFRSIAMAHIYSLGDEKIGFAEVVELKSDIEIDRRPRNSGDGSWRDNRFGLIASHNYKISWDWYKGFTLTDNQPTKTSLDWRESGSPQGRRSLLTESRRPADRIVLGKGERPPNRCLANSRWLGNYGKEAYGFFRWAFGGTNKGKVSTHFSPCKH